MIKQTVIILVFALFGYALGFYMGILASDALTRQIPEISVEQINPHINEQRLFLKINEWRVSEGLAPYRQDPTACELAEKRIEEIKTDFSHDGFWDEWCNECDYWGENLAIHYWDEAEVLNAWLASPDHAENLRSKKFNASCVANSGPFTVHFFTGYF